jgi:hypothetical protein
MNVDSTEQTADTAAQMAATQLRDIRHMTEEQFIRLGVSHVAYVKPVEVEGERAFAIHAADGTAMALAPSADVALAAILQHEMAAVLLH